RPAPRPDHRRTSAADVLEISAIATRFGTKASSALSHNVDLGQVGEVPHVRVSAGQKGGARATFPNPGFGVRIPNLRRADLIVVAHIHDERGMPRPGSGCASQLFEGSLMRLVAGI